MRIQPLFCFSLAFSTLPYLSLSTFSGTNVKLLPRIHPVLEPGTFLFSQSSSWRSPGSPRPYRRKPYTTFLLLVSHRTWVSLEHECIPNSFRGLESQKADQAKVEIKGWGEDNTFWLPLSQKLPTIFYRNYGNWENTVTE